MKLAEDFAVLKPDLTVDTVPVGPTLYPDLDARYDGFRGHVLVSEHAFDADWGVWERHPAGDELVVLLDGEITLVLRRNSADERLTLDTPGAYAVVPANTWHTAHVEGPARCLFITPGEGTQNEEEPRP